MTAVVLLGVIALVAAIVAWMTWHRGADERESVQHHQHTLNTLRDVADRRPLSAGPSLRRRGSSSKARPATRVPLGPSSNRSDTGSRTARPRTIASTRRDAPSPASSKASAKTDVGRREKIVFSDEIDETRQHRSAASPPVPRRMGPRLPGAADQARRDGRARVRRARAVAAVAFVVVVVGSVGGALALGGSTSPVRVTHHRSHPITTANRSHPTTTVASAVLAPTAPTSFSAKYAAPSAPYTVAVDASASCWVMATDPSTGHTVWAGTVAPGASHSLSVTGNLEIQLGAPTDASVTMNGKPVQLPAGFRSPFNVIFVASA
jgi:hypothetical protein